MNNISPLIPIIIIFIVGVNLIESLIQNLIGRDKDKNEIKETDKKETKKKRKKIFNSNWSLKNKKGRMADYMDDKDKSIYESEDKTKVKRRKKPTKDFPDEIKIGENSLFDKENLKGDILKGIVMKEILDKPRAKRPYKSPYREN